MMSDLDDKKIYASDGDEREAPLFDEESEDAKAMT
jgi:hypothetical protein